MDISDLRRLTGATTLLDGFGAACEVSVTEPITAVVISVWHNNIRALLDAVGWGHERAYARSFPGGCSLAISAPIDALYAATDILEQSWLRTRATFVEQECDDFAQVVARLIDAISAERVPAMTALFDAASQHGVTFLGHDDSVSLGFGTGRAIWAMDALPAPNGVDWSQIHDIPVAMVTGTNGKSTTVRLAAAIGTAAGLRVGLSSSDWVKVGTEIVDTGDFSGPAGARLALRDARTQLAVIETARGGLMRRGLPMPRADVCLITNIAADHLGDYGIHDVPSLADAKFLLARAVAPGGCLVLNADDPELVRRAAAYDGRISWFTLAPGDRQINRWVEAGGDAAFVKNGVLTVARSGTLTPIIAVADFAPALGGAAQFNIANALGALAVASALDLPIKAMKTALAEFDNTPEQNPGRGNFIDLGGLKILIDFAHNPHGIAALARSVANIPANRRLIVLGQAGDRSDDDTREMTRAGWLAKPDMVVVKELMSKLRGRAVGEVPAVIVDELHALGAKPDGVVVAGTEFQAVRRSLEWARPGDFLMLLLHENRTPTMDLIDHLRRDNWQAGQPLPD